MTIFCERLGLRMSPFQFAWVLCILESSMEIANSTRIGPYEVVAPLGAGGMGEVYRARDTRLLRDVAIKFLAADLFQDPRVRARFEREARAISSLNHPNICAIYDIGYANIGSMSNVPYLVLEYLEGETLENRLKR